VDALVGQEARLADVRVLADIARALHEVGTRSADERALDDAVVIARPAGGAAVRERLGDAAVVVLERRGPDGMGDPVAVGTDWVVILDLLVEEVERGFGPFPVGDVPERLPAAVGV
jgi:hypothetical protein